MEGIITFSLFEAQNNYLEAQHFYMWSCVVSSPPKKGGAVTLFGHFWSLFCHIF